MYTSFIHSRFSGPPCAQVTLPKVLPRLHLTRRGRNSPVPMTISTGNGDACKSAHPDWPEALSYALAPGRTASYYGMRGGVRRARSGFLVMTRAARSLYKTVELLPARWIFLLIHQQYRLTSILSASLFILSFNKQNNGFKILTFLTMTASTCCRKGQGECLCRKPTTPHFLTPHTSPLYPSNSLFHPISNPCVRYPLLTRDPLLPQQSNKLPAPAASNPPSSATAKRPPRRTRLRALPARAARGPLGSATATAPGRSVRVARSQLVSRILKSEGRGAGTGANSLDASWL